MRYSSSECQGLTALQLPAQGKPNRSYSSGKQGEREREKGKRGKKEKKSELFILIINTSVWSTHTQPSLTLVITPTPKNARQSRFGDVSKDLMLHCV